jgi:hypothetical protein
VICDGGTVDIDINSPTLGAVATLDNVNYGAAGGTLAPGATFTDGEKITRGDRERDKCPGNGELYVQYLGEWMCGGGY